MATVQEALELAVEYHLQGRLTEARELYGRILAVEPDQPHALHLLGVLHGQEGRPLEAMARIRHAIASAPDVADFHANFGKLAMALRRADEAMALHRRALMLRPGHPDALAGLAPMLAQGAPTDEAVSVLRQILHLKPEDGGLSPSHRARPLPWRGLQQPWQPPARRRCRGAGVHRLPPRRAARARLRDDADQSRRRARRSRAHRSGDGGIPPGDRLPA
ncbi:tetratricopeptide repeat protein (plasmid) [Azospirillum baldaniorum]|uniref:Tetratricopeptide repeat protein n=1 Tax=Azospirillum baldaniorum TaxID=1064539 RepID=A0A9P1JZI1_9PROT|nr:tetratricopeptide repeat protein [Azospirillum baldaniorum]AWJ92763.1 tetratricopeptide repeat protein [Azospirillum baldaniorum]TWA78176.1 hypothetical protein FBZ85_106336 [Azospirillum brasilense]CCD02706.1 protein of unknown function [Azospirillum baldaniorum]